MQNEQKKGKLGNLYELVPSFLTQFASKCELNPDDPHGSCLNCRRLSGPLAFRTLCLRDIITDASLYREQSAPSQFFTKRWNSMEIKEITEWASSEVKTIRVTQGFGGAWYELEVREFKPVDGDVLQKFWNDRGVVKSHMIPPYGLANMEKAACVLREFVDKYIGAYISGIVGRSDDLLWNTYVMAFKQSGKAKVGHEQFTSIRHVG